MEPKFKRGDKVRAINSVNTGTVTGYEESWSTHADHSRVKTTFCMVDFGYICDFPYYEHELTLVD